jgi:uncharacterized protein (DUF433 family)
LFDLSDRGSVAVKLAKIGAIALPATPMNYQDIITLEPGKRSGKPCIRGMRITVYDVLSYLASGMTTEEILVDFPYLTREDILACLAYAADGYSNGSSRSQST